VLADDLTVLDFAQAPPAERLEGQLLTRNVVPAGSSNVVARTELVRAVGGFDAQLSYIADWDLWLRLAQTAPAAACEAVLVGYVRHGNGMAIPSRAARREIEYFIAKHEAAGVDAGSFLRWIGSEHRRAGRRLQAAGAFWASALVARRPADAVHAAGILVDRSGNGVRTAFRRRPLTAPSTKPASTGPGWLQRFREPL
jgi:hypothetical protein